MLDPFEAIRRVTMAARILGSVSADLRSIADVIVGMAKTSVRAPAGHADGNAAVAQAVTDLAELGRWCQRAAESLTISVRGGLKAS